VFLLSDAARMITGVILPVDGGLSAASVVPDLRT
jgi:enoyl-[acyl-carrier-protein] reductase (NADH)